MIAAKNAIEVSLLRSLDAIQRETSQTAKDIADTKEGLARLELLLTTLKTREEEYIKHITDNFGMVRGLTDDQNYPHKGTQKGK